MNQRKLLRHTKKYLSDFMANFCKGENCKLCCMKKGDCILDDLVKAANKAIDLNDKRRK